MRRPNRGCFFLARLRFRLGNAEKNFGLTISLVENLFTTGLTINYFSRGSFQFNMTHSVANSGKQVGQKSCACLGKNKLSLPLSFNLFTCTSKFAITMVLSFLNLTTTCGPGNTNFQLW